MWIQVTIVAPPEAGELIGLLDDPTCAGGWVEDGMLHLYWPAERWRLPIVDEVKTRCALLTGHAAPAVQVASLAPCDWNAPCARSVRPFRVGRRLVIRSSWAPVPLGPDDIELIIDPKQAFGTGHHATTQILLEWLEAVVSGGEHVVDVGTGSGILAMAAVRFGAGSAVVFDPDPVAIDGAKEAACVNGFGSELVFRVGGLDDPDPGRAGAADLVLGNLDRDTLVGGGAALVARLTPGARLLVSGVLEQDCDDVTKAFARLGVIRGPVQARDGWLALDLHAPAACES